MFDDQFSDHRVSTDGNAVEKYDILRVSSFGMVVHYWVCESFLSITFAPSRTHTDSPTPTRTLCLIFSLLITYFLLSEFISKRMMLQFTLLYPLYLILGSCIGLYGHFRQIVRYSAWNATVRT